MAGVSVYPRVCGGTTDHAAGTPLPAGLSPRMRGNLCNTGAIVAICGSIPAYAGEPGRNTVSVQIRPVYPRVCGGTGIAPEQADAVGGLSPRMRGNRAEL